MVSLKIESVKLEEKKVKSGKQKERIMNPQTVGQGIISMNKHFCIL